MKKDLEQIDSRIREALTAEEATFYDELDEQGLIGKLEQVYKGKLGWLAVIMNVVTILLVGFFVYCLIRFLGAETPKELIVWGFAGFMSMMATGMLKLYFWMQMDKNDIKRELKRIELQIAALSGKSAVK